MAHDGAVVDGFYIIGARAFGREVLEYALDAEAAGSGTRPLGFIDDDPQVLQGFETWGRKVLSAPADLESLPVGRFAIALGEPHARRQYRERVEEAGGELVSIIHPTAFVSKTARIGSGSVLCPGAFVGAAATIDSNGMLNVKSSVNHDCTVGRDAVLAPHAVIAGRVRVGEGTMLGTNCTVLPNLIIYANAIVGAGSVVTKGVPAGATAIGVPARTQAHAESPHGAS